jgi:predicted nuclease of predicted toxin-antitoxin system
MKKFLIDVNLPYHFSFWNKDEYEHIRDINEKMTDEDVWNYAKERNLTIISKDSDFSNRIIVSKPPPKIIHIRIGNVSLRELFNYCSLHWEDALDLNKEYKLVNIFKDRIEAVK